MRKKSTKVRQVYQKPKPTIVMTNPLMPDPTTGQIDLNNLNKLYAAQNEIGMTYE